MRTNFSSNLCYMLILIFFFKNSFICSLRMQAPPIKAERDVSSIEIFYSTLFISTLWLSFNSLRDAIKLES